MREEMTLRGLCSRLARLRDGKPQTLDYRTHFGAEMALYYEREVYARDSHDRWVWEQQQRFLERFVANLPTPVRHYLDFACGTGRVISFLESRVGSATGIDVSQDMLDYAGQKVTRARLVCGDATQDPGLLDGPYDLITAFRFLLNAGDELRGDALELFRSKLSDDGYVILNIHGNRFSMRWPGTVVRRVLLRQRDQNQLSYWETKALLEKHGFTLTEVVGFALLVPRAYKLFGRRPAELFDALVRRAPFLRYFCIDLLFVCQVANDDGATQARQLDARRK